MTTRMLFVSLALTLASARAMASDVNGTFIQLHRATAERTVEDWAADFDQMQQAGIDTLIVQWSAQDRIAYFTNNLTRTNAVPCYEEQYPILDRIFAAAEGRPLSIHLGLHNDSTYWTQIGARDRVLRDYFLIRVAQNEAVQKALLSRYGANPQWVGYYLPDEIDDLTWRAAHRHGYVRDYLDLMGRRLRTNDAERTIAISTFFRGRTSPDLYARNMMSLTTGLTVRLDRLLVQDGIGVGNPPAEYLPEYYKVLRQLWPENGPELWVVIEAFEQTSKDNEAFVARPATADRLLKQIEAAKPYFDRQVIFTFPDYVDPDVGPAAQKLYRALSPAPAVQVTAPTPEPAPAPAAEPAPAS